MQPSTTLPPVTNPNKEYKLTLNMLQCATETSTMPPVRIQVKSKPNIFFVLNPKLDISKQEGSKCQQEFVLTAIYRFVKICVPRFICKVTVVYQHRLKKLVLVEILMKEEAPPVVSIVSFKAVNEQNWIKDWIILLCREECWSKIQCWTLLAAVKCRLLQISPPCTS